jgi:Xaa-Pro aminopeptidase
MSEFQEKQDRITELLAKRDLDALLLQRVSSFAWATCGGRSYINTATSDGGASLLITPSRRYVITNNIEAKRLEEEEGLGAQGWQFHVSQWYEPDNVVSEWSEDHPLGLARGLRLGADGFYPGAIDLSGEIARLRANLTPEEGERFRALSRICAEAMDAAIRAVRPGQTEQEIAAILALEMQRRGAQPIVNLIATDERIYKRRHPLPTDKQMQRYAMLVLCGRKWGLVCSITRLVHFGRLPGELKRKEQACAEVDATFIAATRPGRRLADIFKQAVEAYAAAGFTDEWQLHHQGGPAGYEPREWVATPDSTDEVRVGQVYAWNPSITGCKSEDTILVGPETNEVLTTIASWPMLGVTLPDGRSMTRPAILEIK